MKPVTIISLAVTTVATLIPINAAIAQSVGQLRACRDYVASRREFQGIPYSAIQVFDRGSSNSGRAAVDWRINRIRNATGYCIVDRRERVTDFRITQNSGSGNIAGNLETNWGNSVRPYRARIISDNTTIVNRPDRRNKRDIGEVRRNESITVYRTYYESSSRITWYLIEGSRRQRGWINADRVDDRVEDEDNDFGEDSNVETNWGNAVRPYRAVIGSDDTTIVNRPNRSNKRDVERVSRNESITVLRTYYESSSRITWYLIRGSRGQEGWINSDRILERSPR